MRGHAECARAWLHCACTASAASFYAHRLRGWRCHLLWHEARVVKKPTPLLNVHANLRLAACILQLLAGLYGNAAPGTVAIFLKLVNEGLLNGTVFSRILPGELAASYCVVHSVYCHCFVLRGAWAPGPHALRPGLDQAGANVGSPKSFQLSM